MNLGTIIDLPWWYKIWQRSGYNPTHAKQKLLRKHKRACKSSWSQIGSLKSFTLTIPWNLAKLVKIFHGIIVRQRHTDQKQMGLQKEQCAECKKVRLRYCCNQVWMENGGQIRWNAAAICETFKIFCLMGGHHMKGGSECHLTDQYYRLEQWSNITIFLRKTNLDCISLEQKSCQGFSRLCIIRGANLERRHYGRRQWRIGGDGRIRTPRQKAQCPGSVNADERWQIYIPSRIWNSQNSQEETDVWNHPTLFRHRPERGEEPEVLRGEPDELSSPNPLQDDSTRNDAEAEMISGLLREISFIAITWNPESNCTCREKNHFLFRWSTSTSPEQHIRHWMWCWKNILMIAGTWMEKDNCQMHGQASQDSFYWMKGHLKDRHGPGWDWSRKQITSRPDNVWPGSKAKQ